MCDGYHRDESTLVGKARARTNLAARVRAATTGRGSPDACRRTFPQAKYTTKLLVLDLGDARNARRGRRSLRLGGRGRIGKAGLHF